MITKFVCKLCNASKTENWMHKKQGDEFTCEECIELSWVKNLLEEFREFSIEDYRNEHHTCYPLVDEFLGKSKVWNGQS
jgi:hypothetical protein